MPGGTEPIILHRDAVSGGGYFMLGTVISADMDLIAQLQPHMPTQFVEVTMDQALAARANRQDCSRAFALLWRKASSGWLPLQSPISGADGIDQGSPASHSRTRVK
ncbi:hypothetical protein RTCIAT899_PC08835 (plasmid) [Rhizobium tropici CIAT 899]|uniref:Carboxyltransferase domain-containing protein n=1 Tax=Rhizobium tropici TaxID=398 RepID=A0ABR6QZ80_RHITR|nr:hypothetical protein RTCIAT899_PC08835 [Rhizobium tropici CIAT 899]MBB4241927.1 hypothetical protein [Rhizobium tropici]MBB5593427.1 hypothetical protein [Rhizobium tropici]MBB6492252.1 hypothetical protein [Rhizobium tropici]